VLLRTPAPETGAGRAEGGCGINGGDEEVGGEAAGVTGANGLSAEVDPGDGAAGFGPNSAIKRIWAPEDNCWNSVSSSYSCLSGATLCVDANPGCGGAQQRHPENRKRDSGPKCYVIVTHGDLQPQSASISRYLPGTPLPTQRGQYSIWTPGVTDRVCPSPDSCHQGSRKSTRKSVSEKELARCWR
jgi:hypothetical protein